MIIRNGTNANIERHKSKLGLSGDVYLVDNHLMESLESHRRLFPDSTASTIEQAESERIAYEQSQAQLRLEQAQQAEAERLASISEEKSDEQEDAEIE